MKDPVKGGIGVAIAVVGAALLSIKGMALSIKGIALSGILDFALIGIGGFLVAIYCAISWDWFKSVFGNDASEVLFAPPLFTFGVVALYYGATANWLYPPHDIVLIALGVAVIIAPGLLLGKALKNKKVILA